MDQIVDPGPASPPVLRSEWSNVSESEHAVQFYDREASVLDSLTDFVGAGLTTDEACLIIASKGHRDALEERLRAVGFDLETAHASGRYQAYDAADTLSSFLVDGAPDPERFAEVVGGLLARLDAGRRVRIFGEMVSLLLTGGRSDATIALEELWNGLRAAQPFRLLCAYPIHLLGGSALAHPIAQVCARHSRVVPAGSYPRHGAVDEQLRAIVALQQQASSLQAAVDDLSRLHEMSARLSSRFDVESVLREVLASAMAMHDTGRGLLSLCDPERPGLVLGVHAGFDDGFLKEVERVPPGGGGCGTCYEERRRIVIEDVETDSIFAPYREAARRAGFRACHSTPLFTQRGDIIGVLSVHFPLPHRPSQREIRLMDLYTRIAADAIENARLHRRLQQELDDRRQSLAREHMARAEAESANRMKDEFLATVSHELRTPLNAILGWAHILRSGRPDEATMARGAEVIERNAHTQAQLIEDILDASRITTGSLRLHVGPVDLASVITTATESVRFAAEAKGVELTVLLDQAARHLSGDAGRLQQIVWNLLTNAIKFTDAGGRVEVQLTRMEGHAQIRVTDTGEGIAPEFLPFVFDRFRQADSTITRRHGGLGLGLAIVRHLVELHEGTVHAESPGAGHGSTFVIRLPMVDAKGEAQRPHPDVPAAATPALQGVQVLLVDDDQDALDMLSLLLAAAGASVRTPAAAAMPDQDGYSLIRSLRAIERESGRETPAVALTAYVRVQDRARAAAAGFNTFVKKPVNPQELIGVIAGVAATRGATIRRVLRERPDPRRD
jgi:signal transduction histidine kinase